MTMTADTRYDWTERTPPFRLSAAQLRLLAKQFPLGHGEDCLQHMHRVHCYRHRQWLGVAGSLDYRDVPQFDADYDAHIRQHREEAWAEYRRAIGRRQAA